MSSSFFITSRIVSRIIDAAAERGVDPNDLCLAAGIDRVDVSDFDAQIDFVAYLRVWQECMVRIADSAFPLSIAQSWDKHYNLLCFICRSSTDVGEALERGARYLRIITNCVSWEVERGPSTSTLAMVRKSPQTSSETRYAESFSCAEVVNLVRAFTGADWNPVEVRFAFAEPADVGPYRALFRAPLLFLQPRTEIVLQTTSLTLPLLHADPAVADFFESHAEKLLRTASGPSTATDDVKKVLSKALRGSVPTLDDVAESLKISGRTLRRRLLVEETSFQRLVDETRFSVAKRHIASGEISLSMIAFLLGFADSSAFHRAFRRWSGMTPQAYARATRSTAP